MQDLRAGNGPLPKMGETVVVSFLGGVREFKVWHSFLGWPNLNPSNWGNRLLDLDDLVSS